MTKAKKMIISIIVLSSCSHHQKPLEVTKLFEGQVISVCGQKIGSSNLLIAKSSPYAKFNGFSIADHGPTLPSGNKAICVEAAVTYLGCETGPMLCTDWAYDYGIKINRELPQQFSRTKE